MNPMDLNLRTTVRPQPVLAALKSLVLPGLGQWHNGQIDRAAWFFLAFAFLCVPAMAVVALWLPPAWTAPALALGLLLTLGVWTGAVVDAWRTARRGALPGADPLPGLAPAGGTPVWRMAGVTLLLIVLCDVVALPLLIVAVRAYVVEPYRIPSSSMAPALWPGDFIFADKRYARNFGAPVRRGDVAVFAYPNDRTMLYVKRVVALPGDRVQLRGSELRVNGGLSPVPPAPAIPAAELAAAVMPPGLPPEKRPAEWDLVVPAGQVFVLGDRREASVDSRDFGTVPMQDVVGRVRQIWFSWGPQGVRWERLGHVVQ